MSLRSQKLSLIDAFLYSLMVGAGETYLPAYCLSIGMGEVFAGLLTSLPIVSGAFLQLLTPKLLAQLGSAKHWVVLSVAVQAFTFVPLIYFSSTHTANFALMFLILTVYWASGFSAGPAWNYWMGRLVSAEQGQQFFAKRARVSQYGILLGLTLGGISLHNRVDLLPFSSVFTTLFIIAFIARLLSSYILSKHSASHEKETATKKTWTLKQSYEIFFANKEKKRFFLYLFPFQAAVFITGPFVTPYMLAQVHMGYSEYMIAVAMLFIGKILVLSLVEHLGFKANATTAKKLNMNLFWLGLLLIAPMPMTWAISSNQIYIMFLQLISGAFWALVEVGLSLIFFQDISEDEKVPVLTIYNFLNALAIIIGTTIGGQILLTFGEHMSAYKGMFVFGGILRTLTAFWLFIRVRRA